MTNQEIINLAACHVCCAMRGEPCTFPRPADPSGKKRAAKASHADRIKRAQKKLHERVDAPPLT